MIILRKAEDRELRRRQEREDWITFSDKGRDASATKGFGDLRGLHERRLPPRTSRRKPIDREADVITYVVEGTIAFEDSTGRSGLLSAGEFQRMTSGRGIRYGEMNTSSTQWAHVFQLWLRPWTTGLESGFETRRFSAAERRGRLCLVASPDGRRGSLTVHQDAFLFSSILESGQHIVHPLGEGRCAWLHVVRGSLTCGDHTLVTGDGAGIVAEHAVSLTANDETEVLLVDLASSEVTWLVDRLKSGRGA